MANVLVIQSSPRGSDSFTRKLVAAIVTELGEKNQSSTVTVRDLALNPLPHLEEVHIAAFRAPPETHGPAHKDVLMRSDKIIAEVKAADVIVIGVPMYNFSIPSVLKSWIDHLARAGQTFRYTEKGPEGLVKGKKVYLALASGGIYSEGPYKAFDFADSYMRAILGFIGVTDVTTFRVEGVAVPAKQEAALQKAIDSIKLRWSI